MAQPDSGAARSRSLWVEWVCRTARAEAESSEQGRGEWMPLKFIFFSIWELDYSGVLEESDQMKQAPHVTLGKVISLARSAVSDLPCAQ